MCTRTLAEAMVQARSLEFSNATLTAAQRAVLDWLGSALAGAKEPPAVMARTVVASLGRSDEATVFGAGKSSAFGAALANGVSAHILELDDLHQGSTLHAAAPVISAAVSVAEREKSSGLDLLRAVIIGYDVALRIGEAVNPSHYRFWHPTGTVATFGAAAAAATLLLLDTDQMQNALGTAGTQAAGLWEFNADGAMSKHLHPGKAAANGILAADLARAGFSGASQILEGERGFARATTDHFDVECITRELGRSWKIEENSYKMYPCCGHTHSAIDAALALCPAENIERIEIQTYGPGYEIVKERNPKTPYQAKFSLAYVVAAAFAEGRVALDQFDASVAGSAIAALLPKVHIEVTDEFTAAYPQAWPARVRVLAGGAWRECRVDFPRGTPQNPATTEVLEQKLHALISPRYDQFVAARCCAFVRALPTMNDISSALHFVREAA